MCIAVVEPPSRRGPGHQGHLANNLATVTPYLYYITHTPVIYTSWAQAVTANMTVPDITRQFLTIWQILKIFNTLQENFQNII